MGGARLGLGELATPQMVAGSLRSILISTVERLAPEVLQALHDEVLPVYARTWDALDAATAADPLEYSAPGRPWPETSYDEYADYPELAAVGAALVTWGKSYRMGADWVFDAALRRLYAWYRWPTGLWAKIESADLVKVLYPVFRSVEPSQILLPWDGEDFALWWIRQGGTLADLWGDSRGLRTFEYPMYWPSSTDRGEYRAAVLADFTHALDTYLDATETAVSERADWQSTPKYRALHKHMEWLVRCQVLRQPWPEIAESATRVLASGREVPVSADYVARRVKKLAAVIGLQLVPVRGRGRPPNSPTVNTTGNRVT